MAFAKFAPQLCRVQFILTQYLTEECHGIR